MQRRPAAFSTVALRLEVPTHLFLAGGVLLFLGFACRLGHSTLDLNLSRGLFGRERAECHYLSACFLSNALPLLGFAV